MSRNRILCTWVLAAALLGAVDAAGADLAVEVGGPAQASLTQQFLITVQINNIDAQPASNVVLTIPLPEHVTFVSMNRILTGATPECTHPAAEAGGTIVCTFPAFTSPIGYFVRLRPNPPLAEPQSIEITASLTQGTADPNPANDQDSIEIDIAGPADLIVSKRLVSVAPDPVFTDYNLVTYEATATNLGPNIAREITLLDTPSAPHTYVTHSCENGLTGGGCCFAQCVALELAPQQTMTLNAVFRVLETAAPGTISNTVTATSQSDLNPANDSATVSGFSAFDVPISRGVIAILVLLLASTAVFLLHRS